MSGNKSIRKFKAKKSQPNSLIALLLLVLAQGLVGVNIVGSKYLVAVIPIFFLLVMRFGLAVAILLPLHFISRPSEKITVYFKQLDKKDWLFIFAQAVTAGVLFNCLMLLGLHYASASIAGIITSALPALIAIMSWLAIDEKLTTKRCVCILLATLGLIVISIDKFHSGGNRQVLIGALIIFIAMLPEASYYVLCKMHPNRLPSFLIAALVNSINAIILLPLVIFFTNWHLLQLSWFAWLILIIISACSGFFYALWYMGSHKVDAIMGSLSTAVMPLATVIIAWLALGERINLVEFIGMVLVIFSIVVYAIK